MDTPDVTPAQKGAVAQLVAAVTAAAALGLGTVEFVVVVAAAALLAGMTVLADARIRAARNHRAAIEVASVTIEPAGAEVAAEIGTTASEDEEADAKAEQ